GLKNGFALSEEAMDALYPSLKEARNQLTRDIRYLKVMKPKLHENIIDDQIQQNIEEITDTGEQQEDEQ
ncbi:unnamed protein product, partial [Didymodactylos carnosus]